MSRNYGVCKECGAPMEGDGYITVLHCPHADGYDDKEADANPVYCVLEEQTA